jgi:hypothetical protein
LKHSPGHYLDLSAAILGLVFFPAGFFLRPSASRALHPAGLEDAGPTGSRSVLQTTFATSWQVLSQAANPSADSQSAEIPCRRHTSAVFAPASASRKIPIICSSLNRLPFICPSPFSDGLYL